MNNLDIKKLNDVAKDNLSESTLYDKSYPKALATFIENCQPPITIALQGEWGSGKTTMMNMVLGELGIKKEKYKNGQYIYIPEKDIDYMPFNAWLFSQFNLGNQLPFILLSHLSKQTDTGSNNKFKDTMKIIGKLGVSAVNFATQKIGGPDNLLNTILDNFTPDDIDKLKNLNSDFDIAVENKLKYSKKKKLLIFIDDIDRVAPDKAVELLEAINLFCKCKNCIFVLAVDYDVILKGAKKKFGDDKGQAFFDKIIQVPFNMPIALNKLETFLNDLLCETWNDIEDENEKKEILNIYTDISKEAIGSNPRSIKRLLNSFAITDYVAKEQEIYSNNNIIDHYIRALLYSLLCIENDNSDAYEHILKKTKTIEEEGYDNFIKLIDNILKDEENDYKNEFNNVINFTEDEEYKFSLLEILNKVLIKLKSMKINKEILTKIFNISSVAISKENKKTKKVPEEIIEFNDICNNELAKISLSLKEKHKDINFKFHNGSSRQHKPHLDICYKKDQIPATVLCVYDDDNPDMVNIAIMYYKDKMQEQDRELYRKVCELKLSEDANPTTTGIKYMNVLKFNLSNFDELESFIEDNIDKLGRAFN